MTWRDQWELDSIDKTLIRELQVDGRRSYAQLAPEVGLSEAATRQRVNRLTERGLIQIVAVTDPLAMGFTYQAMVGITVTADVATVADELAKVDAVEYLVIATGRFDILAEVVCTDADHFLQVLDRGIRGVPGVLRAEAMTYLRVAKQNYDWGTR